MMDSIFPARFRSDRCGIHFKLEWIEWVKLLVELLELVGQAIKWMCTEVPNGLVAINIVPPCFGYYHITSTFSNIKRIADLVPSICIFDFEGITVRKLAQPINMMIMKFFLRDCKNWGIRDKKSMKFSLKLSNVQHHRFGIEN